MKRTCCAAFGAVLAGILLSTGAQAFDWYTGDYEKCSVKESTADIVECVGDLVAHWDARLNDAYKETMSSQTGARAKTLRDAQRAWIAWRDANCGWYRAGEGTIAAIEGNACIYALTRDRAVELETYVGQ